MSASNVSPWNVSPQVTQLRTTFFLTLYSQAISSLLRLIFEELSVRLWAEEALKLRLVCHLELDEPAATLCGLVHLLRLVLQRLCKSRVVNG